MGQMTQPTVLKHWSSSSPKDQASIPPGPRHHVTILQHAIYRDTQNTYIHNNESKHSEIGPVRQNPIQW